METLAEQRSAMGYLPSLDGVRGLAVLVVLLLHFPWTSPHFPGGTVGVDLFFVLSGFLITTLLLYEHRNTGTIALGKFYARRALRLLPALGLFLAVYCIVFLAFPHATWVDRPTHVALPPAAEGPRTGSGQLMFSVSTIIGYLFNWARIFRPQRTLYSLSHLWSLSIEEQFYLGWPLIVALVLSLRNRLALPVVAATGTIASALITPLVSSHRSYGFAYLSTPTRAQALLIGCFGGWLLFAGGLGRLPRSVHAAVGFAGIVGLTVMVLAAPRVRLHGHEVGLTLSALLAAGVVFAAAGDREGPWSRVFSNRVLGYVGQRSYALYLWSLPIAVWTRRLGWHGFVLGVIASLLAAEASWRLVESRALNYRHRFSAPTRPPGVSTS